MPRPSPTYEEWAVEKLWAHGYRITMPRVLVIQALAGLQGPLGTYALAETIHKSGGKIDVASVYRITSTLVEVGAAVAVGIGGSEYYLPKPFDGDAMVVLRKDGTGKAEPLPQGAIDAAKSYCLENSIPKYLKGLMIVEVE